MYAATLQDGVCNKLADNGCMKQLPEYEMLCSAGESTTAGARAVVSLSVTMVLIMAAILVSVLF